MSKKLMRLKEARQYLEELGCPLAEQTCYDLICAGKFAKGEKIGKFWVFEPSALEGLVVSRVAPKPPRLRPKPDKPFIIKSKRREQ